MGKIRELSDCELVTMKCIWDSDGPITAQEIMKKLKSTYGMDYKDTTVYTFVKNLKQKGFVDSYRKSVTYYIAVRKEKDYLAEQLEWTKNFWFGGSLKKYISSLLDNNAITKEYDAEVAALLAKLLGE